MGGTLVIDPNTPEGANTNVAQTQGTDDDGNQDHSIQFFVSTAIEDRAGTTPHKIRIEVTGLTPYVATFTFPDTVDPEDTTIQTNPLEGN